MESKEFAERAMVAQNKSRLEWAERKIMEHANEIGKLLKEIHDKEYWRNGEYESFESYCGKRWQIGKTRSYQLLKAENTRLLLADAAKDEPEIVQVVQSMNERQLREVANEEPKDAIEALRKIHPEGAVSSVKLRKEFKGEVPLQEKPKQVCPHCGKTF